MIDKKLRDGIFKELSKKFGTNVAKKIEHGIYKFSEEYAENNGTPFLTQQIYETKSDELMCILTNKNLQYLIHAIKQDKIKPEKLAFMKPSELNPEQYSDIIKKQKKKEMKDNKQSDAFECKKCKKRNCSIIEKQVRSGDEPATPFVTCLECGHVFML